MIAIGLIVGILNGLVYVVGRIPHPFIVTLATLSIVQSIGTVITHGQPLIAALSRQMAQPLTPPRVMPRMK